VEVARQRGRDALRLSPIGVVPILEGENSAQRQPILIVMHEQQGEDFDTLAELKQFLRSRTSAEAAEHFGITDPSVGEQVTNQWFDDERNYDGRWAILEAEGLEGGRILDMAAGCGTFLLYGLRQGYDVHGIEPEDWKLQYFRNKVRLSGLPLEWRSRIARSFGESLPFGDCSFDLVTSYQTLEHVTDARSSLYEMLRVLKPGGTLYLRAPNYDCFFEPHYRVPFLPRMPRALARPYLRALGKPTSGLDTLTWTTTRGVVRWLKDSPVPVSWSQGAIARARRRFNSLRLPMRSLWRNRVGWMIFRTAAGISRLLEAGMGVGRRERNIDLWIRRL
jgi:2-polyprenyl-3-methyl-5-hydroxy-6-metoxy-1,4-benzoquinol methylase